MIHLMSFQLNDKNISEAAFKINQIKITIWSFWIKFYFNNIFQFSYNI